METKVQIFEKAISAFGLDAALEYFDVPNEKRHLFEIPKDERQKEEQESQLKESIKELTFGMAKGFQERDEEIVKLKAARHHQSPVWAIKNRLEEDISYWKSFKEGNLTSYHEARYSYAKILYSLISDEHPSSLTGDVVEFKKALQDIQQACVGNESIEAARLSEAIATNALK